MIITKLFVVTIQLSAVKHLFSGNISETCLALLKKKFEGVCYKKSYIIQVIAVIRMSKIRASYELKSDVDVDITFSAKVVVYHYGEIIPDCVIKVFDAEGIYRGENKTCGISIDTLRHPHVVYHIGDVVPIRVLKVAYMPGVSAISVIACPFVPMPVKPIIYAFKAIDDIDKPLAPKLFYLIDVLISKMESTKQKQYVESGLADFMKNALYQYKSEHKLDIETKSLFLVIKDFSKALKEGRELPYSQIMYSDKLNDFDTMIGVGSPKKPSDAKDQEPEIVFPTMCKALIYVVSFFIDYFRNVNILMDAFPTLKSIKENQSIWTLYSMYRKE